MAPCELEQREQVGSDISISMYRIWQTFGGGYDIVARNGTELERIHTRSLRQADETFAMLIGKYSGMDAEARETMYAYAEQRQASRDADDLYAWATGR